MSRSHVKLALICVSALLHQVAFGEYATNYTSVDVSRWRCLLCEFETYVGTSGELATRAILTTDDSDRFGRDGSFERAGTRTALNGRMGVTRSNGWLVSASATNIGLDSNDIALGIKGSRSLEASLRFQQYRRLTARQAMTPYRSVNGRLALGPGWKSAFQTHDFENLETSNRLIELATTRRSLASSFSVEVIPNLTLSLEHSSISNEGVQETFRDGILQATALPKTIDRESVSDRIQLAYRTERLNAAWTRTQASFENFESLLQWESPYQFGLTTNESANAFAHAHENDTLDVSLALSLDSQFRIHERRGTTTTRPKLLRYGSGPFIEDVDPVHLYAERELRSRRWTYMTALPSDVEIAASHSSHDIKDFRPHDALTPALGGLFLTPSRLLRPGDMTRRQNDLAISYRPAMNFNVRAKAWKATLNREAQEIATNDTRGVELKLTQPIQSRWSPFMTLRRESRTGSAFQAVSTNNPHTRRFYQADMKRHVWTSGLSFRLRDNNDVLSIAVELERQGFTDSRLGLTAMDYRGLTLGYGSQLGARVAAEGHLASYQRRAAIDGSQSLDLTMPWQYASDDRVNSAGMRFNIEPFLESMTNLTFDYTLSDGRVSLATIFEDATSVFPNQISRHESFDLVAGLRGFYGTTINARIYVEQYDAGDWSLNALGQTTLTNVMTLGRDFTSHTNTLISLAIRRNL